MTDRIYLDNAATKPLSPKVKDYIISILDDFGNPSSLYDEGVRARYLINQARSAVATFINAPNETNILFTPSGSASNMIAINYALSNEMRNKYEIFYSPIAHKSILKALHGKYVNKLFVDKDGVIRTENLEDRFKNVLQRTGKRPFVIIDYANSEIGTIQPVKEIIEIVHKVGGIIYLDCTGSISTVPLNVQCLDVDMIGFSGHKLGTLKGTGVLYKKDSIILSPLVFGTQEQGIIGGTENVLGIASLGKAIQDYDYSEHDCIKERNYLLQKINTIEDTYIIGRNSDRLANNLYVCFKGVSGEALMLYLNDRRISVSTGTACNSGEPTPSSTLVEIGIPDEDLHSCIRMTLSGKETYDRLDYVFQMIKQGVRSLRLLK